MTPTQQSRCLGGTALLSTLLTKLETAATGAPSLREIPVMKSWCTALIEERDIVTRPSVLVSRVILLPFPIAIWVSKLFRVQWCTELVTR